MTNVPQEFVEAAGLRATASLIANPNESESRKC